jgi:hypothetical protein
MYFFENNLPTPRGMSANVICRGKYEKGEGKKGENVKEKGERESVRDRKSLTENEQLFVTCLRICKETKRRLEN